MLALTAPAAISVTFHTQHWSDRASGLGAYGDDERLRRSDLEHQSERRSPSARHQSLRSQSDAHRAGDGRRLYGYGHKRQ